MTSFKYTPLDLEDRSFRLLQLCSGKGAFVECHLFNALLHDARGVISYEALSYTWGGAERAYPIVVNGEDLAVTKNLFLALQHLRYPGQDRILWIDAICINQDNDKERGHQVGQMTSIYEQAEGVVIWLGLATAETDQVFDFIDRVKTEAEKQGHRGRGTLEDQVRGLQDQMRQISVSWENDGLLDLLRRPWFTRVWIIQEVAKARSTQVLCGTRSVSGYEFAMIPRIVEMPPDTHCQAILDIMPGPTRKHSWWSRNRDLHTLLLKFKDSEASDPRDVIYALLGISSDGSDSEVLTPNYEKSLEEVVQDVIEFLLSLRHESDYTLCLPRWSLHELLQNLEILGEAVFVWAIANKHEATVKLLLTKNEVDVNFKNADGQTPLLMAANDGDVATMKLLLTTNKVDINFKNTDNQTPLLLAANNGHEDAVRLLLDTGKINVNFTDRNGRTPLLLAARNGHKATVKVLLNADNVDVSFTDKDNQTPLSLAAHIGHEDIVGLLLDTDKVDVNSMEAIDQTSLLLTTKNGHEAKVKALLQENKIDINSKDQFGRTPLFLAAENGHEVIVKLLINKDDIDPSLEDLLGWTPLWISAVRGYGTIIELLLDFEMSNIQTPIGEAILARKITIAQLMRSDKVSFDVKDKEGKGSPLWWAAYNGYDEIFEQLLRIDMADLKNQKMWIEKIVACAIKSERVAIVKLLLDSGKLDGTNQALIMWAIRKGHVEILELLVEKGKTGIISKEIGGKTLLQLAAEGGQEALAHLFLSMNESDVNIKDYMGRTPLWEASQNGHTAVVRLLVDIDQENVDLKDKIFERTPLSIAASFGHEAVVRVLISTGKVDVNSKDKYGLTPLSLATRRGDSAVVRLLEEEKRRRGENQR